MQPVSQRMMCAVLVALGALAIAVLAFGLPRHVARLLGTGDAISLGMMYGTLSAPFALFGFWAVLGTQRLVVRLVLIFVGMATVALTLVIPILQAGEMRGLMLPAILTLAGVTLSALVAAPLWQLTARRGIQLRHVNELSPVVRGADQQFGIRELLVITVITAALLGGVRWLIEIRPILKSGSVGATIVFYIGMVVLIVFGLLPLLVAPLLRRFALPLTALGILLLAVGTVIEIPIAHRLGTISNKTWPVFWSMNFTQAAWLLATLGTLRAGGYRLAGSPVAQSGFVVRVRSC